MPGKDEKSEGKQSTLSHTSKVNVNLSYLYLVYEMCDNAIFHHWTGSILIKGKSASYLIKLYVFWWKLA